MITVTLLAVVMLATPLVAAKPWTYPKTNPKFEEYGVTYGFDWANLIGANYAATAGLEEANKVVIVYDEIAVSYQIRIGEAGPEQRIYNLWDPIAETGDFTYSGVGTITVWDPVLPYAFDPDDVLGTLFVNGRKQHFRVDYTYDFSAVPGGLDGTITYVALISGNSFILNGDKPMHIFDTKCTGDFQNVQVQATAGAGGTHMGVVSGWPEIPAA